MITAIRALRPVVALTVLIMISVAAPLFADYRTDYTAGLEAVQRRDWPEVERLMRAAAAAKGSEGRVRLYGMRFDPYIPHYYIGVALLEQGDCAGALNAWLVSESQGFITKIAEYAGLQAGRERCRELVAQVEPTPVIVPTATAVPDVSVAARAARDRIEAAEEAAVGLASLRSDDSYRAAWAADPNLARRSDQTKSTLQSARTRLLAGERTASEDELAGAVELADRAAGEIAAIRGDLDRARQQLNLEAQQQRDLNVALRQARGGVATAADAASEVLQRAAGADTLSQEGRTQRGRLQGLLRQADGAESITSTARLRDLEQKISSQTAVLERSLLASRGKAPTEPTPPTTSGPPRQLRMAAAAFFGGDYRKTLSLLEGADFSDPRAIATAHLLRAGAHYSFFMAGGEEDEELRRSALDELRRSRQARQQMTLDPTLFSPRFVELAKSVH
ncbi:MAG: hypothetical protein ACC742_09700 [Thermoanaerobaculales bacterium]